MPKSASKKKAAVSNKPFDKEEVINAYVDVESATCPMTKTGIVVRVPDNAGEEWISRTFNHAEMKGKLAEMKAYLMGLPEAAIRMLLEYLASIGRPVAA